MVIVMDRFLGEGEPGTTVQTREVTTTHIDSPALDGRDPDTNGDRELTVGWQNGVDYSDGGWSSPDAVCANRGVAAIAGAPWLPYNRAVDIGKGEAERWVA